MSSLQVRIFQITPVNCVSATATRWPFNANRKYVPKIAVKSANSAGRCEKYYKTQSIIITSAAFSHKRDTGTLPQIIASLEHIVAYYSQLLLFHFINHLPKPSIKPFRFVASIPF